MPIGGAQGTLSNDTPGLQYGEHDNSGTEGFDPSAVERY